MIRVFASTDITREATKLTLSLLSQPEEGKQQKPGGPHAAGGSKFRIKGLVGGLGDFFSLRLLAESRFSLKGVRVLLYGSWKV